MAGKGQEGAGLLVSLDERRAGVAKSGAAMAAQWFSQDLFDDPNLAGDGESACRGFCCCRTFVYVVGAGSVGFDHVVASVSVCFMNGTDVSMAMSVSVTERLMQWPEHQDVNITGQLS